MSEPGAVLQEEIGAEYSLLEIVHVDRTKSHDEADNEFNAEVAKVLRSKGFHAEAGRIEPCGEVFVWRHCVNGHTEPHRYSNCGLERLCPRCARIEREAQIKAISAIVGQINARPIMGYRWRKVVLPVKTEGQYLEAARRGWAAWRKLWRGVLKGDHTAALVSGEYGPETGNFHFHVLYYGPYVDQEELSRKWEKYTGGSEVTWIAEVKGADLQGAIREQVKYISKFSLGEGAAGAQKADAAGRVVEIWESLRGQNIHLLEKYGLFRKDCLERWLGEAQEEELEAWEKPLCSICGGYIIAFERNCQTPRAPPADPDVTPIRAMHERTRARVDEEVAKVQQIIFDAYQAGKPVDLEQAKKKARCLVGRGEKARQLGVT